MPKLQIIGAPQSNFVWVTHIVAAEKRVDYESVFAMPHTPAVYACNPLGKIPAMRHGEVILGESRAICAYIDRAFAGPSLIPAEPAAAALTEQWASIVCSHVDPLPESQQMLAGARHLTAYLERHLQRPSIAATIPPPMSQLPAQASG